MEPDNIQQDIPKDLKINLNMNFDSIKGYLTSTRHIKPKLSAWLSRYIIKYFFNFLALWVNWQFCWVFLYSSVCVWLEAFLCVVWNLYEIHFQASTQRAVEQHRCDISFPLSFPLCLFSSPILSYLSCLLSLTSSHPHHPLPTFFPLSVEAPLGEFSSRRMLTNEKKLLTLWGVTLFGDTKTA